MGLEDSYLSKIFLPTRGKIRVESSVRTVTLRQYLWGLFLPQQQCYFAPFTSSFHSVWKKQLSLLRCIWKCFIDKEGQGSITVVLLPFNKVHAREKGINYGWGVSLAAKDAFELAQWQRNWSVKAQFQGAIFVKTRDGNELKVEE